MESGPEKHSGSLARNLPVRIPFAVLILLPFLRPVEFWDHIVAHLTGGALDRIIRDEWYLALLNIIIFLTFLIPLKFRRKIDWKEYGLVSAFFVSLFVEMYGIPLTVLFASRYYGGAEVELPNSFVTFTIFGVNFSMTLAMVYGLLLMTLGTVIIVLGWVTLYRNLESADLVTTGIYAHSRHPQYFGFILVILGWLIAWPTILVIIFSPILVFIYVRVCLIEERELEGNNAYEEYRQRVPFFI